MEQSAIATETSIQTEASSSLSRAVVEAVSTADSTDPLKLPRLCDALDPDALDSLFQPCTPDSGAQPVGEVRFTYAGYRIVVDATGQVEVRGDGE